MELQLIFCVQPAYNIFKSEYCLSTHHWRQPGKEDGKIGRFQWRRRPPCCCWRGRPLCSCKASTPGPYSPLPPGLVTQSLNQTSKPILLKCPVQFVVRGQQWAGRRHVMFVFGLDSDFCFSGGCNETVRLFRKGSRVEVVQELLSQYLSGRFLCKMSLQKHVSTLEMNVLSHE